MSVSDGLRQRGGRQLGGFRLDEKGSKNLAETKMSAESYIKIQGSDQDRIKGKLSAEDVAFRAVVNYLAINGMSEIRDQLLISKFTALSPSIAKGSSTNSKKVLESFVLDYLGRNGFTEIRDEMLTVMEQDKSRSDEATIKIDNSTLKRNPICDRVVYKYLSSNPSFQEVADDFVKDVGSFKTQNTYSGNSVEAATREKKKSDAIKYSQNVCENITKDLNKSSTLKQRKRKEETRMLSKSTENEPNVYHQLTNHIDYCKDLKKVPTVKVSKHKPETNTLSSSTENPQNRNQEHIKHIYHHEELNAVPTKIMRNDKAEIHILSNAMGKKQNNNPEHISQNHHYKDLNDVVPTMKKRKSTAETIISSDTTGRVQNGHQEHSQNNNMNKISTKIERTVETPVSTSNKENFCLHENLQTKTSNSENQLKTCPKINRKMESTKILEHPRSENDLGEHKIKIKEGLKSKNSDDSEKHRNTPVETLAKMSNCQNKIESGKNLTNQNSLQNQTKILTKKRKQCDDQNLREGPPSKKYSPAFENEVVRKPLSALAHNTQSQNKSSTKTPNPSSQPHVIEIDVSRSDCEAPSSETRTCRRKFESQLDPKETRKINQSQNEKYDQSSKPTNQNQSQNDHQDATCIRPTTKVLQTKTQIVQEQLNQGDQTKSKKNDSGKNKPVDRNQTQDKKTNQPSSTISDKSAKTLMASKKEKQAKTEMKSGKTIQPTTQAGEKSYKDFSPILDGYADVLTILKPEDPNSEVDKVVKYILDKNIMIRHVNIVLSNVVNAEKKIYKGNDSRFPDLKSGRFTSGEFGEEGQMVSRWKELVETVPIIDPLKCITDFNSIHFSISGMLSLKKRYILGCFLGQDLKNVRLAGDIFKHACNFITPCVMGRFSKEEDRIILEKIKEKGENLKTWQELTAILKRQRYNEIEIRYNRLTKEKFLKKGRWKPIEDEIFLEGIIKSKQKFGIDDIETINYLDFKNLAITLNRSIYALNERWFGILKPILLSYHNGTLHKPWKLDFYNYVVTKKIVGGQDLDFTEIKRIFPEQTLKSVYTALSKYRKMKGPKPLYVKLKDDLPNLKNIEISERTKDYKEKIVQIYDRLRFF